MSQLTATEIALAFNQQIERKAWSARQTNSDGAERVHFISATGMVRLIYDVRERIWYVRFTKVNAAWGDYIRAIARSLYIVLTTLKSGGLAFDAPENENDIKITCMASDTDAVYVTYEAPPIEAPEK